MPVATLKNEDVLILDERDFSVQGVVNAARERWPELPPEQIELPRPDPSYEIRLREIPRERFNPNHQLTVYPRLTLAQVVHDVAGHFGIENLDCVRPCWNNGYLHFSFIKP